ncbi:hypothetical protein HK405_010743, partial [Cladochytrium tenue]
MATTTSPSGSSATTAAATSPGLDPALLPFRLWRAMFYWSADLCPAFLPPPRRRDDGRLAFLPRASSRDPRNPGAPFSPPPFSTTAAALWLPTAEPSPVDEAVDAQRRRPKRPVTVHGRITATEAAADLDSKIHADPTRGNDHYHADGPRQRLAVTEDDREEDTDVRRSSPLGRRRIRPRSTSYLQPDPVSPDHSTAAPRNLQQRSSGDRTHHARSSSLAVRRADNAEEAVVSAGTSLPRPHQTKSQLLPRISPPSPPHPPLPQQSSPPQHLPPPPLSSPPASQPRTLLVPNGPALDDVLATARFWNSRPAEQSPFDLLLRSRPTAVAASPAPPYATALVGAAAVAVASPASPPYSPAYLHSAASSPPSSTVLSPLALGSPPPPPQPDQPNPPPVLVKHLPDPSPWSAGALLVRLPSAPASPDDDLAVAAAADLADLAAAFPARAAARAAADVDLRSLSSLTAAPADDEDGEDGAGAKLGAEVLVASVAVGVAAVVDVQSL